MTAPARTWNFGPSAILLLIAIIVFVLAAFGVHIGQFAGVRITDVGLAFLAASFLL